jgi:hypothetical protein
VNAVIDRIAAELQLMRLERDEAAARVAPLARRVYGDDDNEAKKELEDLDGFIDRIERRIDYAERAIVEAEREEREKVALAEEAERARLEEEEIRLQGELDAALRGLVTSASATGRAARAAVEIGSELAQVRVALGGNPGRSVSALASDLVTLHVRDQEPRVDFDTRLHNHAANLLRREYAVADDAPAPEPAAQSVPACTVCASERLAEIEQALAAGETLRAIETKFGVSRSSLSRHRRHG